MSARDQIVETTSTLLELQGYYATGLNQIINESGSPKGSLYYYFPGGKEELAAAAIAQAGKIVLQRIHDSLASIADPVESIYQFIMNVAHYVELSGFRAGGPITTVAVETANSIDRLRAECQQIYAEWQTEFREKLMQGGIDEARAGRLAVMIIASMEGAIVLCRTGQSRQPLESVAEEIALLLKASHPVTIH